MRKFLENKFARYARAISDEYERKSMFRLYCAKVISCVIGLLVILLFFSSLIIDDDVPSGYAYPFFVSFVFLTVFFAALPYVIRLNKVEKRQKKALEEAPEYALNLAIYREYAEHAKVKGKVVTISMTVSIVLGFALAIPLPDTMWSFLCILPALAGLYLNSRFVSELRKKVIPIEREIDEKEAASALASEPKDYSVSVESPAEGYVIAEEDDDDERC